MCMCVQGGRSRRCGKRKRKRKGGKEKRICFPNWSISVEKLGPSPPLAVLRTYLSFPLSILSVSSHPSSNPVQLGVRGASDGVMIGKRALHRSQKNENKNDELRKWTRSVCQSSSC